MKSLIKTIDLQVSNIQLGGINTFCAIDTIKISKINKNCRDTPKSYTTDVD